MSDDEVTYNPADRWVRRGNYIVSPEKAVEIDAAAAEFIRERLEQIRQLEEDVRQAEDGFMDEHDRLLLEMGPWWIEGDPDQPYLPTEADFDAQSYCIFYWVRRICSSQRILARLEAALADLKRGMKP